MRLIIVDILTTTIDRRKRIAFIAWIRSIFKTANFPLGLMQFICCLSIHMFCSMCRWTLPFTRNLPEQLCAIFEAMPPQYRAQNLICSSYHDIINACDANEIEIRSTALFDCAAWSGKAVVRFQSSYIYFFFIAFISHTHTQQYIFLAIISVIRGMKIGWVILSDRLTMCNIANRIGPRVFAKCAAISVVHAYAYEFSTQPQIHSRGSLNNTLIIIHNNKIKYSSRTYGNSTWNDSCVVHHSQLCVCIHNIRCTYRNDWDVFLFIEHCLATI